MLASRIVMKDLTTVTECYAAIESIEGDRHNYYGDLDHWLSGRETILKKVARDKIDQIYRKADKLSERVEDQ